MAKHIILKCTKKELLALVDSINSFSAMMEECVDSQKDVKAIDRMLKRSGYKRDFN